MTVGAIQRLGVLAVAVLTLQVARAETTPFDRGVDALPLKLAVTGGPYPALEAGGETTAGTLRLSLGLEGARGLMGLRLGDERVGELLSQRLDLHLAAAFALRDDLVVAADLPLTLHQRHGLDLLAGETGFADDAPAEAGPGDVRVLARWRLPLDGAVRVWALGEVRAPTGADDSFLGERGLVLAPRLVVERSLHRAVDVAAHAGYRYRSRPGRYLNLYVGDELELALAAAWRLPVRTGSGPLSLAAEVDVATPARAPFSASDALKTPASVLMQLRVPVARGLELRLGGGTGLARDPGYGREGARIFASVGWVGEVAGSATDRDGDGLRDGRDRCPDLPGPAAYDGCPDADGDEIPDAQDACPDRPGPPQNRGCPVDPPLARYREGRIELQDTVSFDTGRATVRPDSYPLLDAVAAIMAAHPEIRRVRVDGHTDSQGAAAFNLDLSERRARAVVGLLLERGVEAARLTSRGFGESEPVAPNDTALGRANNRRVEFTILDAVPAS